MTMTTALTTPRHLPAPALTIPRGATAGLAVVGGGLMIGGALLPWLTVYGGLDVFRGTDGLNGRVLLGAGVASIACGVAYSLRPHPAIRAATGLLGFGASGFAAWVVAQLIGTLQQLATDPFAFPGLGLGTFVALAGGLCTLGVMLIPTSHQPPVAAGAVRQPVAGADARTIMRTGVVAFLLAAAMIHLAVIGPHLSEVVLYAAFFVGAGAAQVGAALLFTLRPSRRLLVVLIVGNALLIALWAVSRTVGLPFGSSPRVAETVSPPDVLASTAELVVVMVAVALSRDWTARPIGHGLARLGVAASGVIAATLAVVGVVGVQAGGG